MQTILGRFLGLATGGLSVLALFCLLVAWLHLLDQLMTRRLISRWGWSGLMLTGWLGTPVHEGSHVLACWLFGHRVDRVVWFQPDPASERLGYVQHSYDRRNVFQEIGNLFIALAPLVGGGVATILLLKLFFPDVEFRWPAPSPVEPPARGWATLVASFGDTARMVWDVVCQVAAPARWGEPRFWLFLYLATCLASHAVPSRSDYAATLRGILLCGLVLTGVLAAASLGSDATRWMQRGLQIAGGFTAAYAVIASAVSLLSLLVVFAATGLWDLARELFRRPRVE